MLTNEMKEFAYKLQQKIQNENSVMDKAIDQGNFRQQIESAKKVLELSDDFTTLIDYSPTIMMMDLKTMVEKQKISLSNNTEAVMKLKKAVDGITNIFINFKGKNINKDFADNIESAKKHFRNSII